MKILSVLVIVAGLFFFTALALNTALAEEAGKKKENCKSCHSDVVKNFNKSLHHTNLGMTKSFEEATGKAFGIEMPAGCMKCHIGEKKATSCTTCHKDYGSHPEGHGKKVAMDTCVKCHKKRSGANYTGHLALLKKKGPHADVHYERGLECMDCHTTSEIHGDGKEYKSQFQAVKVKCEDCHINPAKVIKGNWVTQYVPDKIAHELHAKKLACTACHQGWYQSCKNCHFDTKKTESAFPTKNVLLAKGGKGKIKPFYCQTVVLDGKTSTSCGEYTPHTITDKPRSCVSCHRNKEALLDRYKELDAKILTPGGEFLTKEEKEDIPQF